MFFLVEQGWQLSTKDWLKLFLINFFHTLSETMTISFYVDYTIPDNVLLFPSWWWNIIFSWRNMQCPCNQLYAGISWNIPTDLILLVGVSHRLYIWSFSHSSSVIIFFLQIYAQKRFYWLIIVKLQFRVRKVTLYGNKNTFYGNNSCVIK